MNTNATRAAYEAGMKAGWIAAKADVSDDELKKNVGIAIRKALSDSTDFENLGDGFAGAYLELLSKIDGSVAQDVKKAGDYDESFQSIEYDLFSEISANFVDNFGMNVPKFVKAMQDSLKIAKTDFDKQVAKSTPK